MNKIIGGKKYDTETARLLGETDNGLYANDFAYWEQRLYRTKTGNYFIYGAGGPRTDYVTWSGNNSSWGERITPVPLERAQKWAEDFLSASDYERIFGEIDEEKIKISADITPEVKDKLDKLKVNGRKSNGDVIEYLLSLLNKDN